MGVIKAVLLGALEVSVEEALAVVLEEALAVAVSAVAVLLEVGNYLLNSLNRISYFKSVFNIIQHKIIIYYSNIISIHFQ